jgi:hypothetical protein
MHPLTEWLREKFGDAPPSGPVDDEEIVDELDELAEGYEAEDR